MAAHLPELIAKQDERIAALLSCQNLERAHRDYGGVMPAHHADPRGCGHALALFVMGYVCRESAYYLDDGMKTAIGAALEYCVSHARPGGCVDLSSCNFDSAPDTAFMLNHTLSAWALLDAEDRRDARTAWLREPLMAWITRCAEGVRDGGFHTPNHRWAIASCLLSVAKITGRADFAARAGEYLSEGLDINEDGEFAERSAGNYNQVNDDQMIRLYLATGETRFLEAARANLDMMLCYIDPDGSVFTNNSTRQDYGRKVYLDSYYQYFLLVGYLLHEPRYGAMAECIMRAALRRGVAPDGAEWLLLYHDLDGYGADAPLDRRFERYDRLFPASGIARVRSGRHSLTLMEGRPNFLYFSHGALTMYMVIYANVCDKRNFVAQSLEKTEAGYRLSATVDSWYYLPFYPQTPATSDWWAMDNEHTRRRARGTPLTTVIEVTPLEDGADVLLRAEGLSGVPLRVEMGFTPGCEARTDSLLFTGEAGRCVTALSGGIQLTSPEGDAISIPETFARHNALSRMGGAYPQSAEHFTVYMTEYTPCERLIRVRAGAIYPVRLD